MTKERVCYHVRITATSPLLLSNRPASEGSSVYQSLEYIPGTSIRGAWIEAYKRRNPSRSEKAYSHLISEKFMDRYWFDDFSPEGRQRLPLTAITCKQFPGFKDDEGHGHGVKDSLLLYYRTLKRCEANEEFVETELTCQRCQSVYTSYGQWVNEEFDRPAQPLRKIQSGHVAILPVTQTIVKGKLFFEQTLDIDQSFEGKIHVPVDDKAEFEEMMEWLKEHPLRVGAKRTSGYGEVKVMTYRESAEEHSPPLRERFYRFQERCREMGIIGAEEKAFSLTMLSDGVFVDRWFRFRADLTPELLTELTGVEFPGVKLVYRHVELRRVYGWNQKWNVALDEQIAVKAGSSYLYIVSGRESEDFWIEQLERLEQSRIGKRIHEGFGRLRVCDSFHVCTEEV
ncbi:RAMP superfamily CRISPR-associated protein [Geobacillus sp. C56-T2]|uniref:RAMP superfamily CRISPR-associated protein n=1 Tax=Geobacillus sp. C56-T2 TaxID=600773 RepID=UPI0011AC4677|nr:RAMP superfamily CRISPR-associated protein [Geobacillus sp. C56-T2]TWG30825.1 CRISPR-associated Csx10 family RAMP protein [Geobacillus sp. C56-T2]